MHNAALRAVGLHGWRYQKLPIPPDDFAATVRALERAGFRGVNVTIPHKEAALALADEASATATAVGAANTLTFEGGRIAADNTDVSGLLQAIPVNHAPGGRRALVLGAGGAGRAAVHALVSAGAADVQVWNRTPERARRLATGLGARAVERPEPADLVVQCTSVGLHAGDDPFKRLPLDADALGADTCVVDMVYSAGDTAFLAAARAAGADVVDGLEVLVGQGAAAFERWTGRPAPIDVMRRAVMDDEPA
jgi:shikimate dehydrogenase